MTPRKALAVVARALADGLRPNSAIGIVAWAKENFVLVDGPRAGEKWREEETPYLSGILNCLDPAHPATRVDVRKSAQVALTTAGMIWVGHTIAVAPCKMMVVQPTLPAAQDYNREKLAPAIAASQAMRAKVRAQKSRSAEGSTATHKRFSGGSLILTGANSAADLRSKTVQRAHADEVDEWPLDLDGQGDPSEMLDARQIAFHRLGTYKRLNTSTPTIAGASRIDRGFCSGDQRFWQVPCPHCQVRQRLEFFPDARGTGGLVFDKTFPYRARYVCRHCGAEIGAEHQAWMVRAGEWVATCPGPGRNPSFHIDALCSLLTTWDKVAEAFLNAKDDPQRLKAFYNLWLGLPWEERGEAPDWSRLFARREEFERGSIPLGGVALTGFADVQQKGIYVEIVAWGGGEESWSLDAFWIDGDTALENGPVWDALSEVVSRRYADSYGNTWPVDAFGIDSGYQSNAVYLFTRRHDKVFATKGFDGWYRPALGAPTLVDVSAGGRRSRRGCRLWPIGTWPLKAKWYAQLRLQGRRDGAEIDPAGYAHFSNKVHDENYFRQITAEHLKEVEHKRRGVVTREWVAGGPNHFLDCRIGNMALADYLRIGRMPADEWERLVDLRSLPQPKKQEDLFVPALRPKGSGAEKPVTDALPPPPPGGGSMSAPERPGRRKIRGSFLRS